jgi:hypothetical protein
MADEPLATPDPSRLRYRAFLLALGLAVLLLALPMAPFLVIPVAWPFLGEQLGAHQLHDVGVATLLWLLLAGLLSQFRRTGEQVGGMQQTLLVVLVFLTATSIGRPGTLLQPMILAFLAPIPVALLHPARREVARVRWRVDPWVAVPAVAAAVPLLAYARGQLALDASFIPVFAHGGHWTTMAAVAASIPVVGLLAAGRPPGWRVPAWSAGLAAILFGAAFLALQHRPSSVGMGWSGMAVAWGLGFIVLSEVRGRRPVSG